MESLPDLFVSPVGSLQLERYPQSSDRSLRAWDAADEYLLDYLVEQGMADTNSGQGEGKRALLVNDTFGACLLYTSPSPRDQRGSRMPSSA